MEKKINVNKENVHMLSNRSCSIELGQLVGLWLAEGDSNSKKEITITNSCFELIVSSYKVLKRLFSLNNFRIYCYVPNTRHKLNQKFPNVVVNTYIDKRARKPYFILRLANVKAVREWKKIVKKVCNQKRFYIGILSGFFAGEGNINSGSHSNRTIRISQKSPLKIIDKILDHLLIHSKFSKRERAYVIVGRQNWDKFAKFKLADLHPDKKKKFMEVYSGFSQYHYSKHHIRNTILNYLNKLRTSSELAIKFRRSQSRIQRVLVRLKRERKVQNYRVESKDYWISNKIPIVPISKRKETILGCLNNPKRNYEIADILEIDRKVVSRRLQELSRLGLVSRNAYYWYKLPVDYEVKVL